MRVSGFSRLRGVGFFVAFAVVASLISTNMAHAAETSFTIAAVPDTQNEVMSDNNPMLYGRYNWLNDNKGLLNLKFIDHTGDNVNWGVVDPIQFTRYSNAVNILDNSGVPYTLTIGNHDTAAVMSGGSAAPGNVHDNLRNTTLFNQTLPLSRFKNVQGVYEAGKVDNMWQTFSAGGVDWLVITHEMWPRESVIQWMKGVVSSHPSYNVVVSTHAFINYDGSLPTSGNYGDQNAQVEYNEFISQYANIKMVLSGHYGPTSGSTGFGYKEFTGVNGNKIAAIMTAYHSNYQNHVRLLRIDTAANTISSSVYVSYSNNIAYPTGYITDAASNFVSTDMNWIGGTSGGDPQPPVVTAPGAPTGVTATAGNASATVSFASPVDNGGSAITGYTVTSSPGNITATGTSSPITVTGLTNGTDYTFTVRATNSLGAGAASTSSNSVTPTAPTGVTELLTDPGFENGVGGWQSFIVGTLSQVTSPVRSGAKALSIAAVSTSTNYVGMTNNSVITNSVAGRQYTAQCYVRPVSSATNVQIRFLEYNQSWGNGVTLQTVTASSLPAGQWSLVKVSATANNSGDRMIPQIYATNQTTNTGTVIYDDCSVSYGTAAPVVTVPDAPTNVTAAADDGEATISFTAPANNGGSAITSYTVTSSPGNISVSGSGSPITVGGLTNGTNYTFTVTATNSVGSSVASGASAAVKPLAPATAPDAPTSLATTAGNGTVKLNWIAPASDGGAAITDYATQYRESGSSTWLAYADGVSTATTATVTGLANYTTYEFTVSALNAVGVSPVSAVVFDTPMPVAPSAPRTVSATASNGSATISFAAPASDGGAAVTSYTVTSNPGNIVVTNASSPIIVSGLTNGVSYTFTVTATNAAGISVASVASNAVTPVTTPGAPTSLTATAGNAKADLSWTAPTDNGGAVITDYTINYRVAGSSDWIVYNDGVSAGTSVTISGLANGTTYEFAVQATNSVGTSGLSDSASTTPVTPPATVPGAPTAVAGVAGNGQVGLSWSAPVSDGGAAVSDYLIQYSVSGSGIWNSYDDGVSTATNATVTGLTNGTTYSFIVTAQNSVGVGAASAASAVVTPRTTPDAPTNVTATAGNGSVTVSFVAPANNGGAAITGYTVTSSPGNVVATSTGSPIIVSGLMNGTAYTFTVTATNAAGTSVASVASASVTPTAPVNELLSDAGFENGLGGWQSFIVGTLAQTTSTVRSGSKALQITATSTATTYVGMTNNNTITSSVAGKTYTFQCYVRPTSGTLNVQARFLQYTQNYSSNTNIGSVSVSSVPSGSWTLVKVTGTATAAGMRIIPQIYATNQTTNTGAMLYDDCSLTSN